MSYRDSGMTSGPYNIARIFVEGPWETQGYGEEKSSNNWWRILAFSFSKSRIRHQSASIADCWNAQDKMAKIYLPRA